MADDALECGLEPRVETLDEDQALVTAARQDTEAPGRLYDKYYSVILGYIYHCTLDRTATEDLTSNVFLAACGHLGRYRWRQIPFRAWPYRIATNEVRMHYRRHKRIRSVSLGPEHEAIAGPVPPAGEAPAAAALAFFFIITAIRHSAPDPLIACTQAGLARSGLSSAPALRLRDKKNAKFLCLGPGPARDNREQRSL